MTATVAGATDAETPPADPSSETPLSERPESGPSLRDREAARVFALAIDLHRGVNLIKLYRRTPVR